MKLIQKNNINYNLNSFQYLLRPQAKKTLTGLEHIKYLRRLHAKSNFYLIEVRVFTLNVAYFRRKMARFYKNFKKYELLTSIKFLPKANKNLQTILRGPVHDKKTRIQL